MWKRLDDSLIECEKFAQLPFSADMLYFLMLSQVDSRGRFPAAPPWIKARVFTLHENVTVDHIKDALVQLAAVKLIHVYKAGDDRHYLVYHNHDKYNPPGALKNFPPRYPPPPADMCKCLTDQAAAALVCKHCNGKRTFYDPKRKENYPCPRCTATEVRA